MSNDISPETQITLDRLEAARKRVAKREELAEMLSQFINGADTREIAELATDISHDHRTLVQRKFGFFLQFCKVLAAADQTGNYDLRNEYAVKTSVKIMEITNGSAVVPFI